MRSSACGLLAAMALAGTLASHPAAAQDVISDDRLAWELGARDRYGASRTENSANLDPLIDNAVPQPMYAPGATYAPGAAAGHCCCEAESPWAHLGLYGNVFYWLYGGPQYFCPPPPPPPGPGAKNGMLQRVILTETWLAGGDDPAAMGVNDIELKTVLALPVGWLATPLILTPGLGAHYFNGPVAPDVPAHTYDFYLDIRWMRQVSPCVGIDVAVTPGWFSDLEQSNDDALRIGARAIALITVSPTFQIAIGAVYLDRDDVPVLPLGGVIWAPNPDLRLDLTAPRPKIARRISACCDVADWLYIAGEFGGGSWAIERVGGAEDVLNYRDYRAILGWERTSVCGMSGRIEAGYVFGREIEYQSAPDSFDVDDTFMLRAEASY
jgi:hypothetical protein